MQTTTIESISILDQAIRTARNLPPTITQAMAGKSIEMKGDCVTFVWQGKRTTLPMSGCLLETVEPVAQAPVETQKAPVAQASAVKTKPKGKPGRKPGFKPQAKKPQPALTEHVTVGMKRPNGSLTTTAN